MSNNLVIARAGSLTKAGSTVPYLTQDEISLICQKAQEGRNGKRNSLLILTLFQTGLRVSEALSLIPGNVTNYNGIPVVYVRKGKGGKDRKVSLPESLFHRLKSFAFDKKLEAKDRIFDINRKMAWLIVKTATRKAGIGKDAWPHILRHSDAIYRLKATGNPRALQHHLGHSTLFMTMRYLSTLQEEESLKIESGVKFDE
ncbi:MAG: tyrosine-type recombinase/integrase [Candidatus Ratteibacteria bacterium]|jgi:integrase/recombinase XerD